jgi:hypothetical protein
VTVEVREVEPVALVSAGTLRPVDAGGGCWSWTRPASILDLPILVSGGGEGRRCAPGASTAALATVAALRERAAGVADRVSQVELVGGTCGWCSGTGARWLLPVFRRRRRS